MGSSKNWSGGSLKGSKNSQVGMAATGKSNTHSAKGGKNPCKASSRKSY
jgi:hypothetical protein